LDDVFVTLIKGRWEDLCFSLFIFTHDPSLKSRGIFLMWKPINSTVSIREQSEWLSLISILIAIEN